MDWRGFGFVHHSRTIFCRAVPNPNLTIRNFFIAGHLGHRGVHVSDLHRASVKREVCVRQQRVRVLQLVAGGGGGRSFSAASSVLPSGRLLVRVLQLIAGGGGGCGFSSARSVLPSGRLLVRLRLKKMG
jgi:hypothetical protein